MVTKAVIPVAGFGTRFLPASKAVPKEMFPIIDKPIIQLLVEDLCHAGITDILFILPKEGKESIITHFTPSERMNKELTKQNKQYLLDILNKIENLANFHFVHEENPKNMLKSVFCGKNFFNKEPFLMMVGDGFVYNNKKNSFQQLIEAYSKTGATIIGAKQVKKQDVSRYGIIKPNTSDNLTPIEFFVEKPKIEEAPSRLASVGQYLITPDFVKHVEKYVKETGNYPDVADVCRIMAKEKVPSHVLNLKGTFYDTGNKIDYLKTCIEAGLRDEEVSNELKSYIKQLAKKIK